MIHRLLYFFRCLYRDLRDARKALRLHRDASESIENERRPKW